MSNGLNSENADEKQVSIVYREKMPPYKELHMLAYKSIRILMVCTIILCLVGMLHINFLLGNSGTITEVTSIKINDMDMQIVTIKLTTARNDICRAVTSTSTHSVDQYVVVEWSRESSTCNIDSRIIVTHTNILNTGWIVMIVMLAWASACVYDIDAEELMKKQ